MSIFILVKGEKEHGVFEMRMFGGEVLNSYESESKIDLSSLPSAIVFSNQSCNALTE